MINQHNLRSSYDCCRGRSEKNIESYVTVCRYIFHVVNIHENIFRITDVISF